MDITTDERGIEYAENVRYEDLPKGWALCGACHRAWNDEKPTSWTPAPSARCPFEYDHEDDEPGDLPEGLHAFVDEHGHTFIVDAQDVIWVELWPGGAGDLDTWRQTIARRVTAALEL